MRIMYHNLADGCFIIEVCHTYVAKGHSISCLKLIHLPDRKAVYVARVYQLVPQSTTAAIAGDIMLHCPVENDWMLAIILDEYLREKSSYAPMERTD